MRFCVADDTVYVTTILLDNSEGLIYVNENRLEFFLLISTYDRVYDLPESDFTETFQLLVFEIFAIQI